MFLKNLSLSLMLAAGLMAAGCSEESKPNEPLPDGDPDSQEYQEFQESSSMIDESNDEMLAGVFEMADMIGDMQGGGTSVGSSEPGRLNYIPAAVADSFLATYDSATQYWTAYLSYTDTLTGSNFIHSCSLQFVQGDAAVQWPDSLLVTQINSGAIFTANLAGDNGEATIEATHDWSISGAAGEIGAEGDVVINGEATFSLVGGGSDSNGTCNAEINFSQNSVDVEVNLTSLSTGESCPSAGSHVKVGSAQIECSGQNGTGTWNRNWSVTYTFTPGEVNIVAQNGINQWTYDGPCPEQNQPSI